MVQNSPIADLTKEQWRLVTARADVRHYERQQVIDNPSAFAVWLIMTGSVCIRQGQEREYFQQGQVMMVDGFMGEFSVAANTQLVCLTARELTSLLNACCKTAKILYRLANVQQSQSEVLELIEQLCGPLSLAHRTTVLEACQWQTIDAGTQIAQSGESCHHWHLVLHGRLCCFRKKHQDFDQHEPDLTRRRGDCFGQAALLGSGEYQMNFIAATRVRLVMFRRDIFDLLWQHYDSFKQIIATELAMAQGAQQVEARGHVMTYMSLNGFDRANMVMDKLVRHVDWPVIDFDYVQRLLGIPEDAGHKNNHPAWYTIHRWWENQENENLQLLADSQFPAWHRFCSSNCDQLIAFADGSQKPLEHEVNAEFTPRYSVHRWLILCHSQNCPIPQGTRYWLEQYKNPNHLHWRFGNKKDDMRVARTISGHGIGVVFGGGNARSIAQLGVIEAMRKQGVEVDMIAGTNFGALVAAHIALEHSDEQIRQSQAALSKLKPFNVIRLPKLSLLGERKFNRYAEQTFGQIRIEDFWLPFYCVSTNVATGEETVHREGCLRQAVGASRSTLMAFDSMSHEMLQNGDMTLPVDFLSKFTQGPVIAIDVTMKAELQQLSKKSGYQQLKQWFNPKVQSLPQFKPNNSEPSENVTMLHLDLSGYKDTQFDAMEELIQAGYQQSIEPLKGI